MTRPFQFEIGEYYHIYNRGFEKNHIFRDEHDRLRFLKLLLFCNSMNSVVIRLLPKDIAFDDPDIIKLRGKPIVEIVAYCMMGNHFHLLIREIQVGGASLFMQKLTTGYTMFFNTKYERSGSLLQGTFKAKHLDSDVYLKYAFSYIHLNPVEHIEPDWKIGGIKDLSKTKKYLNSYRHSSLPDYLGVVRPESSIVSKKSLPRYFFDTKDICDEMNYWLTFQAYDKV